MKKLLLLFLLVAGGLSTASATTLHIGLEVNYTGNLKVHRFGGTSEDTWASDPTATFDAVKYGRRWYTIDMNGNTSVIVRMEENNWNDRAATVTGISGDDCYMYVSSNSDGTYVDGQKVWNSGKLSSEGWQNMKFSNDVESKWDDDAYECTKVNNNTFTYTLTKDQITAANKSEIYFRFKLANGVFFVGENYWGDHYFRIGSNDSQNGNVRINIANSITNNSYTTDQQKNWYVTVPTYDFEKLVFTIQDVTSGTAFGNETWKVTVDAYISKTANGDNAGTGLGYSTFGAETHVDLSSLPAGVTAQTASVDGSGHIEYNTVTELATGEGVLLTNTTGADVALSIPVKASASAVATNALRRVSSASFEQSDETYRHYILTKNTVSDNDAELGWYLINDNGSNNLTVGTAYLQVLKTSPARGFFPLWSEDYTSVQTINSERATDGQAYNMAGQRIAQPTRGLYIVNGKKVVLK